MKNYGWASPNHLGAVQRIYKRIQNSMDPPSGG